jgi:hypothetical protein
VISEQIIQFKTLRAALRRKKYKKKSQVKIAFIK